MPGEEKPYRVYRGGRQKGKVPLQTRPGRGAARARGRDGSDYRGPGPIKQHKKWSRGRRIGIVLGALLLLLVVWAVASYFAFRSGVTAANKRLPAGAAEALDHQDSLVLSTPTNILILGTDHANQPGHETQHSDSIMLIRTDPSRHRVAYLSIPRDLRVPIEGVGDTKINAAMQSGGAPLAIKTVASYTGLAVNHVIIVDFSQFKDVIDALGGITVDVP
jgi:anionic cell wall polymer biosynthesis LytR-Cps2A-Psr (LCP) family protein